MGVDGARALRERRYDELRIRRTAARETMVVLSRWSMMEPVDCAMAREDWTCLTGGKCVIVFDAIY